jgi:hypothetical protein
MENIKGHISDELLAAFLDGSADLHEMEDVVQAMQYDPVLAEVMAVSAKVDDILAVSYRVDDCLPLAQRAALGKDALCDVLCEEYEDLKRMHKVYHDDLQGNGFLDSIMENVDRIEKRVL